MILAVYLFFTDRCVLGGAPSNLLEGFKHVQCCFSVVLALEARGDIAPSGAHD